MKESAMRISGIAPWYGSKRTLAPTIVRELGPHNAFWDVFCGSMAVTLAKPPCAMETVNDLHGDLINLARCVQDRTAGPILYRRLRRVLNSQALFEEARARCDKPITLDSTDVDRAFDYFLTSWQGTNGVAGTARYNLRFARRLTKNGGHAARRFATAVDSIPAMRRRLRAVTILNCDGIELCEKIEDRDGTVIYADPPYLSKGAEYLHDFEASDHLRLATALRRFDKTRVVVSYYEHPMLAELYPGWTKTDCHRTKSLVSQGRRGADNEAIAPEVLLVNGQSYLSGGGLFRDEP